MQRSGAQCSAEQWFFCWMDLETWGSAVVREKRNYGDRTGQTRISMQCWMQRQYLFELQYYRYLYDTGGRGLVYGVE